MQKTGDPHKFLLLAACRLNGVAPGSGTVGPRLVLWRGVDVHFSCSELWSSARRRRATASELLWAQGLPVRKTEPQWFALDAWRCGQQNRLLDGRSVRAARQQWQGQKLDG